MRRLVVIPVVHTPQDLGSHLEEIRKQYIARYGSKRWRRRLKLVAELWEGIRQRILALPVDFNTVRLYQDGLPECGKELEIAEELAREGSRNHQLLLELVERGAVLVGTESPPLLMEEQRRFLNRGLPPQKPEGKEALQDDLIRRRDEHMAQRIASTLQDGETGLLFIGALHAVGDKVPTDIVVCDL